MPRPTVDLEVTVVRQADAAVLVAVTVDDKAVEAWIPYSAIGDESEIDARSREGAEGVLTVQEWLAEDRGIV